MRDPDLLVYWREEVGGFITGGYERNPAPWPRRHSRRLQVQAAAARLGSLHAADGELDQARAGRGKGRDHSVAQRPGRLYARRRIPARPDRSAGLLGGVRLLRPWPGRRGRHRQGDGRMDHRGHAGVGLLAPGCAPLRPALRQPGVHLESNVREQLQVLRHPPSRRRARVGAQLPPWPGLLPREGIGRVLWREVRLGAPQLVHALREEGRPRLQAARLGRHALVTGHRLRARSDTRGGRPVRRELVHQDRSARAGRADVPAVPVRQRHRQAGGRVHLHLDAQPARRHRVRLHRDTAGRGSLPYHHRHGVRRARPVVDPSACAARRLGHRGGRDLVVCLHRPVGAQGAHHPAEGRPRTTSPTRASPT